MKNKISILLLMLAFAFGATAQTIGNFIDVLYLKNGSKIKGVIVEQIPGKSVKIQTSGGSEFVYEISEIEKFTREAAPYNIDNYKARMPDSLKYMNNYRVKEKGYFANIDALLNSAGTGLRITNGYRFGRFGNIGLAVGLEIVNDQTYFSSSFPAFSLNLVYSGEILNKRITPFYQVEAGYGVSLDRRTIGFGFDNVLEDGTIFSEYQEIINYGGPMAGLALGVKFHTKKKIYYRLALDARLNSSFADVNYTYINDPFNVPFQTGTYKEFNINPGLGIRFGVGF